MDMAKRTAHSPLPAVVELGRRSGKARVAGFSKEEIQELGRRRGNTRAKRLSKERLKEVARKAVQAHWSPMQVRQQDEKS